jgi:uncharacterized protein YcfL
MKSKRYLSLIAAASLALLAGCASPPNAVNTFDGSTNREVVVDEALHSALEVSRPMRAAQGGLLKVQVPVRNVSNKQQYFRYQFVWVDAFDMVITNPQPTWMQGNLLPGEEMVLSGIAPSPKAVNFTLKFVQSNYQRP